MVFDDDGEGDDPAREIYKRGLQKKVNRQSGGKLRGPSNTESMLESNILVAAHIDPRVRHIFPQPVTFDLNTGKGYKSRSALVEEFKGTDYRPWIYTPDFRLKLVDGENVYVEGKHEKWMSDRSKLDDIAEAMRALGHRFLVVTNHDFPRGFEHNLRVLKLRQDQPEHHDAKLPFADFHGEVTAAELTNKWGWSRTDLFDAILRGTLAADLEKPLGPKSALWDAGCSKSGLEVLAL